MNVKWLIFFLFVWFFGMIMGSIFEGNSLETYQSRQMVSANGTTVDMTTETTFDYLFDFSNIQKETTTGSVFVKLAQPDYYGTWFSVMLLDFNFLKDYDVATDTWNETTQSYFFKLLGTIGILSIILMFVTVIQGFIPGT